MNNCKVYRHSNDPFVWKEYQRGLRVGKRVHERCISGDMDIQDDALEEEISKRFSLGIADAFDCGFADGMGEACDY